MILPQFEVGTFPGQLLWLLFAAGITYIFNKKIFLPLIANTIARRNKIIKDYIEETVSLEKNIEDLRSDIELLIKKGQLEARSIIEVATHQSQAMLFEYGQKKNHFVSQSMNEYNEYIENTKSLLAANASDVVQDIKDKLFYFISRQNI